MNRVCLLTNTDGEVAAVVSDEPIRCFMINNYAPNDRVFEYKLGNKLRHDTKIVEFVLSDDSVECEHD